MKIIPAINLLRSVAQKFQEHMLGYGTLLKENEEVLELEKSGTIIQLKTNKASYQAKTVIIASGKNLRS